MKAVLIMIMVLAVVAAVCVGAIYLHRQSIDKDNINQVYMAQALIRDGDISGARTILQRIATTDPTYKGMPQVLYLLSEADSEKAPT